MQTSTTGNTPERQGQEMASSSIISPELPTQNEADIRYTDGDASASDALCTLRNELHVTPLERLPPLAAVYVETHHIPTYLDCRMYVGAIILRTGILHLWAYFSRSNYGKTIAPPTVITPVKLDDQRYTFTAAKKLKLQYVVLDQAFDGAHTWDDLCALAKYYRLLLDDNLSLWTKHHIPVNRTFLRELSQASNQLPRNSLTWKSFNWRIQDVTQRCLGRELYDELS
jgi:hypothetical protein